MNTSMNEKSSQWVNTESQKRLERLANSGVGTKSLAFILGKTKIRMDIEREYGANYANFIGAEIQDTALIKFLFFIWCLYLIKDHPKFVNPLFKILSFPKKFFQVWNIKSILHSVWYYKMDGHELFMNRREGNFLMRYILQDYTTKEIWEPETTNIVKENVKEGNLCIDIGASIGYFTLLFCRLVGSTGKVISIEPTDFQIPYLKRNIKINKYEDRVLVIQGAAWDKEEKVSVPLNADEKDKTTLQGIAIDSLNLSFVDFIKCDTDGSEPWILKGMIKTIERSPNLKMIFEYYPKYVEDAGGDMKEVDTILDTYFVCKKIEEEYDESHFNLFCIRKP